MINRILSVAAPLVSLFLFPAFIFAIGVNVTANCTLSSYSWTFNSIGQCPCTVAAYMLSTCFSQSYTLAPLPSGYGYPGPYHEYSNKCQCSTVGYSLISACVACQNRTPFYWSAYVTNCSSTMPPSQFPNPVPAGIYVPHWALLDVTNENMWNADESYAAGGSPEYGPGAIFNASGVYTSSASTSSVTTSSASTSPVTTSSASASSTAPPTRPDSGLSPLVRDIIIGVGSCVLAIIVVVLYFYLRSRWRRSRAASAGVGDASRLPVVETIQPSPLTEGGTSIFGTYRPMDETTQPLLITEGGTSIFGTSRPPMDGTTHSFTEGTSIFGTSRSPMGETILSLTEGDTSTEVLMRPYDPDDPTSFPYQGALDSLAAPQRPVQSRYGAGSTLDNMQTSRPHGYHGFPMPTV